MHADHAVQFRQVENLRDELVRQALHPVLAAFVADRKGGGFDRLDRMHGDAGVAALEIATHTHHRTAGADAGDKAAERATIRCHLLPQFGAGALGMFVGIDRVGELPRHIGALFAQLLDRGQTAQKAALLAREQAGVGAIDIQHRAPFGADPVGHEDGDGMAKRTADCGKGNAAVAAGRLDNGLAGQQLAAPYCILQDRQRHPVLDAAGQIVHFRLGIDGDFLSLAARQDPDQGRVADQRRQRLQLVFSRASYRIQHDIFPCAHMRGLIAGARREVLAVIWLLCSINVIIFYILPIMRKIFTMLIANILKAFGR